MRRISARFIAWSVFFVSCSLVIGIAVNAEEYLQVDAAIGIETAASGGRYTLAEIVRIATENGVDVVVTVDPLLNRWQYGLWPLRSLIRRTVEMPSVATYGIGRYLEEIDAAGRNDPKVAVIGGLEVAPFYYWEGDPVGGGLTIKDWHKHLLVIGLDSLKDCRQLPVIGNSRAIRKPFGVKGMALFLIPIAVILAGLYCIIEGKKAQEGVYERRLGILLAHWRYIGIAIIITGVLLFLNGFPFRDLRYDQYHGDRGPAPYQDLISYVARHGGMTFWAHPEAVSRERAGKVSIVTGEHANLLLETCGYTGFAVFYEGYDMVGRPRGVWDSVLRRYCQGGCPSPVWAIGMIDYESGTDLAVEMRSLRTVLFVKEKGARGALEAIKSGRMYVAKGPDAAGFRLNAFTVEGASGAPATMGGEAAVNGAPRVTIKGAFSDGSRGKDPVKTFLIRDGEPLMIFEGADPVDITYDDRDTLAPGKHYYRAEMRSGSLTLITNPVFVVKE